MHVYCRCNWFSFNSASAVTLIVWEIPAHDGTMTTTDSPFQGCMIDSGQGHTLDAELTFVRSGVFSQQPLLRASLVYRQNVG